MLSIIAQVYYTKRVGTDYQKPAADYATKSLEFAQIADYDEAKRIACILKRLRLLLATKNIQLIG
jgi:hypothetical protein